MARMLLFRRNMRSVAQSTPLRIGLGVCDLSEPKFPSMQVWEWLPYPTLRTDDVLLHPWVQSIVVPFLFHLPLTLP